MQGREKQAGHPAAHGTAADPTGHLPTCPLDADALGPGERAIFERFANDDGHVSDPHIDALLRHNLLLRRLIADLVASAGRPKPARKTGDYVAEVPTWMIEQVGQHGDFTHIDDGESHSASWY